MRARVLALLAAVMLLGAAGCEKPQESVGVGVLMYHHLDGAGGSDTIISEAGFRRQMDALAAGGYTPVGLRDLMDYVDGTGDLPEKPVCITFDDGYASVYDIAFPILGEYGYPAAAFVIGVSVGRTLYKDTAWTMTPHFGPEEMAEMAASGRMEVQSHTYDMHQWAPFETSQTPRTSMLPLPEETEEEYAAAVREDFRLEQEVLAAGGVEDVYALAFPLGRHTEQTDRLLAELGVRVTLTTDSAHQNIVTRGDRDSLLGLGRLNMSDQVGDEELYAYLERQTCSKKN